MPTIEHLLLPQIEKKQEEIAATLPRPDGYLQVSQTPEQSALAAYTTAIGSLPNEYLPFKEGAAGLVHTPSVSYMQAQERVAPPPAAEGPAQRGKIVLSPMQAGEPIGYAEDGQAVDVKGKKLGYAYMNAPYRTLERREEDVKPEDTDPFATATFEKIYRKHVQALDDNDGEWPRGYFRGMTKAQKDDIFKGVKELRRRGRDVNL